MEWFLQNRNLVFTWDIEGDWARLTREGKQVWAGSLLPALWIANDPQPIFCKARPISTDLSDDGGVIRLAFEGLGEGTLEVAPTTAGCEFKRLSIEWTSSPPAIISLYFGVGLLSEIQRTIVPQVDLPFWADWTSEGYCIPSAKGSPIQSFFRRWDFGYATLPLGNFGPALGTPYAAAYPRPLYCGSMGGDAGWLVFGPGAIPDAAMTLDIRSTSGCLHYRYREDLWTAPQDSVREWASPLRLSWSAQAWDAYAAHFATFETEPVDPLHQSSQWNTWGEYKLDVFENRRLAQQVAEAVKPELFVFDDKWETYPSSGDVDTVRFPDFAGDVAYVQKLGMQVGLWQAVGWIDRPEEVGLTADDLLCGADGQPRRASWQMNPHEPHRTHYCLDPSSERARKYLRARIERIVRTYDAVLLKMDFGYGLPGPDVAAPRDPAYRGERMAYTLYKIVADAARAVNPKITLQCWGLSPLMRPAYNMVALDDLGDAGNEEAIGHRQWSVWAALVGINGTAIMASSGYDWAAIPDILLDTAVIGAPGGIFAFNAPEASVPPSLITRLRALSLWHRRSTQWTPLWLNTESGSLHNEPLMRCWGRLENINGVQTLTALTLRDGDDKLSDMSQLPGYEWSGRWAIIAQGDRGIEEDSRIACIPFDDGSLQMPCPVRPNDVHVMIGWEETSYACWSWKDDLLTVTVDPDLDLEQLTGFLIIR
ncbi:MAG: hypothetical protein K8L99_13875 [Anaerolineae bacterium]|nr:hypothetical protein [Anaerolineae bacterium]